MRETFDGLDPAVFELETLEGVARYAGSEEDRLDVARTALDRLASAIERDVFKTAQRLLNLGRSNGKPLKGLEDPVNTNTRLVDA